MKQLGQTKEKLIHYYENNEIKVDISFFIFGVLFDIVTLSDIDDPLSILQQLVYLIFIGYLLLKDLYFQLQIQSEPRWLKKIWPYRTPLMHFFLGSLLSVYSLFFIKSSSFWASFLFLFIMIALLVGNELKTVQQSKLNFRVAIYFVCWISFLMMIFPVLLGFVGLVPFALAMVATTGIIGWSHKMISLHVPDQKILKPQLIYPSAAVVMLFLFLYVFRLIPPVPLVVQDMAVYHQVDKAADQYQLYTERPWWKFWEAGDQDFRAEPGDKIYFFAKIFSPSRFSDSVILHWQYKDPKGDWQSSDKIPMRVVGGSQKGYRGFAVKQNYTAGDWRVKVETTDGREIGRFGFEVQTVALANPNRKFEIEIDQ